VKCHLKLHIEVYITLLETKLRTDAQLRHEADRNQRMLNEWVIAAAVVDRICFIVFSVVFVVGSAALFILAATNG